MGAAGNAPRLCPGAGAAGSTDRLRRGRSCPARGRGCRSPASRLRSPRPPVVDNDLSGMLADALNRPLRNLRLSVTDRCNLRCSYCMPEAEYVWLPREDLLRFEEISRLAD